MKETPQEKLDYYVGLQVAQRVANGDTPDVPLLREGTAKLLEAADLEKLRGAPTRSRRPEKDPAQVLEEKRLLGPESMAEKMGNTKFWYREVEDDLALPKRAPKLVRRPKGARLPSGIEGERHRAMMRRLRTLLARVPGYRLKPGEDMSAAHVYPAFYRLICMHSLHSCVDKPGSDGLGIYAGKSQNDRHRIFYRELEKICDASNRVIAGPGWWVPK